MIQVLKKEYWSRADAFLLPLTGLHKDDKFEVKSYLFWNEYNIHNYQMILTFSGEKYTELIHYCRAKIFPVLDRNGYLVESYDIQERCIFVLDVSEWAMDIQQFLSGRYSKFSKEAKGVIEKYHTFNGNKIPIHVYAVLYPNVQMALLEKKSPIEYVAENYGLNLEEMKKIGEIGSIYDRMSETLLTEIGEICHYDEETI